MDSADRLTVGETIRYFRDERHLSRRQLSLQAGLSESYAGKVENDETVPSLRNFAKLAVALGMNAGEIYTIICQEAKG